MRFIIIALFFGLAACSDPPTKVDNAATNNAVANNTVGNNSVGNNTVANNTVGNNGGGAVCPGFTAPGADSGGCRSDDDCEAGGGYCAPGANTACGIPCGAPMECFDDDGCADSMVCQTYDASGEACCYPGDESSQCVPPCTDGECPSDNTCEVDGHCRPTSCEAGFTCVDDSVCAPGRAGADAHGCAPPDCSIDAYECPDGTICDSTDPSPTKCAAVRCEDGYVCPDNSRCDGVTQGHGCLKLTCSNDADCDCGACVNSACEPFLWICTQAAA